MALCRPRDRHSSDTRLKPAPVDLQRTAVNLSERKNRGAVVRERRSAHARAGEVIGGPADGAGPPCSDGEAGYKAPDLVAKLIRVVGVARFVVVVFHRFTVSFPHASFFSAIRQQT